MSYPHFSVIKRLRARFDIHYVVAFLPDRLVFVNVSDFKKSAAREAIKTAIELPLGEIPIAGGIIARLINHRLENKAEKKEVVENEEKFSSILNLNVDDVLKIDKHNYVIPYDKIKKIRMETHKTRGGFWVEMIIEWEKKEKFTITAGQIYQNCLNIVKSLLSDRLE